MPVGALKFSYESHVGISSVQQTLAKLDSFRKVAVIGTRRRLTRDAGHFATKIDFGFLNPVDA